MAEEHPSTFLGIEIGGTKLQLAIGAGDGRLRATWRTRVNPTHGAEGILAELRRGFHKLHRSGVIGITRLTGIGVGFGGPVDDRSNRVITSHQVEGWDDFELADWCRAEFGVRAVVGNDADVAGLAEAILGAGHGVSPIFYVTVGSGIGGALIIDQTIYRGVGQGAGEIGHLRLPDRDHQGHFKPLEQLASGWGIQRRAEARGFPETITVEEIGRAVRNGVPVARELLSDVLDDLAEGLCHVIALICPRRIVIGGGVSLLGEALFFEPLRAKVAERVFAPFAGLTTIVPAQLGEEVVLHGALALARAYFLRK